MNLLRLADVPRGVVSQVYRRSPSRAVAAYALGVVAAAALGAVAWRESSWLFGYLAVFVAVVLLVARSAVHARLGSGNWLVRTGPAGLYIQFRSHLNTHLPAEDRTVVYVEYDEIRSAREVRERRTVSYQDSGHRSEREVLEWRRLVELEVEADTAVLAEAIGAERVRKGPREKRWYGTSSTTFRHYPVRLSAPTRIEIEWHVAPGASAFVAQLARFVRVEPSQSRTEDFRDLEALDRAEQERRLATLASTGQQMAAVSLARTLYGLDLKEAKELIERLGSEGRA